MKDIGKRIKELRRKNDLTQEKLADYLGVTDKSVSKWECGLTTPDLSLIVPMARLFHVTTDELLGAKSADDDERKAYFEKEYYQYWQKIDSEADLEIAKQAVAEYPCEYKYLEWLATREWYVGTGIKYYGTPEGISLLESSIKHHQMVLEDCSDTELRNKAISGIVWDYESLDNYDEAKKYAEMYPEKSELTRDEVMARCLKGEELAALRRKIAYDKFNEFTWALNSMRYYVPGFNKKALDIEETIIKVLVDDGNYISFNKNLFFIYMERAHLAILDNKYDEAIKALAEAKKYAAGDDKLDENGISYYTCEVFKDVVCDVRENRNEIGTTLDYFKEELTEDEKFDPLRSHPDFKALLD